MALSPATHYRGWQRLGANVTRFEGGFQRDWHEGLDLYKVRPCFVWMVERRLIPGKIH